MNPNICTNLYLLRSEFRRRETGDRIIDLNGIARISLIHFDDSECPPEDHHFGINIDLCTGGAIMRFSTGELARAELAKMLSAMGADPAMADEIMIDSYSQSVSPIEKAKLKLSKLINETG